MCGIVGVFSKNSSIDLANIKMMNDYLIHRGPDGYGYLCSKNVFNIGQCKQVEKLLEYEEGAFALGHRRLAICDLSVAGHQPMTYKNRYWIVFNGEIYNFLELRSELEIKGYSFISHTDTEVIMAAYDYWGVECVNKFNGMWAFFILDNLKNKVFISRDRFGIKPLYYFSKNGIFAFASEIKALLVYPGVTREPNLTWLKTYLEEEPKEYIKETAFLDIYRFDFACYFEGEINDLFNFENIKLKKYWSLNPNLSQEPLDEKKLVDYAKRYYDLLEDAVRLRLRSDVKVGSALSGGLDSSSIVAIVNKLHKEAGILDKQETFSCVYKTPGTENCDESVFIDQVANALNVKSNQIEPQVQDIPAEHRKMIYHMEDPPDSTLMSSWHTFKLVGRSDVTVTLDGQGADEQLASYLGYLVNYFVSMRWRDLCSSHNRNFFLIPGGYKRILVGIFFNFLKSLIGKKFSQALYRKLKNNNQLFQPLNERLFHDFSTELVILLHYADSTSMAFSIESRMPFMDYRLVEFLSSIPLSYKLARGWTKYLARRAVDNLLPSTITWRRDKLGWPIPEKIWFDKDHKNWLESTIRGAHFLQKNKAFLMPRNFSYLKLKDKIKLLNIAVWYDIFFSKDFLERDIK